MDKGLDLIDIPKDERLAKNLVQTACKSVKGIQSYPGLYFLKWKGMGSKTWNAPLKRVVIYGAAHGQNLG